MPRSPRGKGPQRLLVLVIGVLIVLVAGYFLVQRCQRDREVSAYQGYVAQSNEIAKASATVGSEFSAAILTAGQTPDGLDKALTRQIQAQQQIAANAAVTAATAADAVTVSTKTTQNNTVTVIILVVGVLILGVVAWLLLRRKSAA